MVNVIVSSAGVQGPQGFSVLSDPRTPTSSDGIDGDFWIDTANYPTSSVFYGPRVAGVWPSSGITIGGGGGGVISVNSQTGVVTITAAGLGALVAANNLSDVTSASTARTNLGLGGAALLNVGTSSGTVAAGNDSRIIGAAQTANNLSDLASEATARTNLGLGGAATLNVGTGSGTVAAGNDSRIVGAAQVANNLSDLTNEATARTNLGLGGAATLNVGTGSGTVAAGNDSRIVGALQAGNNLSDVASAATSRTNLGLAAIVTAQSNLTAATNPGVGNDTTQGYAVGSVWVNTSSSTEYVCSSAATGAAVWTPVLPVGTAAGTVAAGNDSRITGALQASNNLSDVANAGTARTNLSAPPTSRQILSGTGLTGGGDLSADRTLTVSYGTTAGTAAQGNDSRITGAVQTSSLPLAIGSGGTGQTSASAAYNALAPTTTVGDIAYANGSSTNTRLAGSTSATKNFLTQTGTGSASAAPAWGTIQAGDLPAATTSAVGAVELTNDLGGTATSPSVLGVHGTTVPASPAVGTVLTATSSTAAAWASPVQSEVSGPAANALLAWNGDPTTASGSNSLATGVLLLQRIMVPATMTFTNLWFYIGTAGATLTANENLVGLYSSAGSLLSGSADQSTAWTSIGAKEIALTTPQTVTGGAGVFVWAAALGNGTTMPVMAAFPVNSTAALVNIGTSAATTRFASTGTSLTALPSSFTPSGLATTSRSIFVGVS